jgi:hypothetical protein
MPKVIIMVAIEKKRHERPTINFVGKDLRKSSSLYRDVRIPKNINNDDEDANNDIASDTMKTMKEFRFKYIGMPEYWSYPPGTVKIAENIMVAIRAATTVQGSAVAFIHFSPSSTNFLCCSVNKV